MECLYPLFFRDEMDYYSEEEEVGSRKAVGCWK